MKLGRSTDIILNVVSPVLAGCLIYISAYSIALPPVVKNYLPDALWAYAFISAILIVWNRRIHVAWLIIVCLLAAGYEILQYLGLMNGTPDIIDVVVYLTCIGLALFTNQLLQQNHFTKTP